MPRGRPRKNPPPAQGEPLFLRALAQGLPAPVAAHLAGWRWAEVKRRLEAGRQEAEAGKDTEDARLWLGTKRAIAELQGKACEVLQEASRTSWHAAAWLLERRFPRLWGKRQLETLREELVHVKPLKVFRPRDEEEEVENEKAKARLEQ